MKPTLSRWPHLYRFGKTVTAITHNYHTHVWNFGKNVKVKLDFCILLSGDMAWTCEVGWLFGCAWCYYKTLKNTHCASPCISLNTAAGCQSCKKQKPSHFIDSERYLHRKANLPFRYSMQYFTKKTQSH